MLNIRISKIDPCGTPKSKSFQELKEVLSLVFLFSFLSVVYMSFTDMNSKLDPCIFAINSSQDGQSNPFDKPVVNNTLNVFPLL